MDDQVEKQVREFYDTQGWVSDDGGTLGENRLFRDLEGGRGRYGEKVAARPAALLGDWSGTLLIVGVGDMPAYHVHAAAHFDEIVCVDISHRALDLSRERLGGRGTYHLASVLDMPLADDSVDAILCAHMLYHVERSNQERAVSEMLRVTKPGGRILIVYINPSSPLMLIQRFLKTLRINKLIGKAPLYVYSFPMRWWKRFAHRSTVSFVAYDAISTNQAKTLLPGLALRRRFFEWANRFEDAHPRLAATLWSYVAIVLDKPAAGSPDAQS